MTKSDLLAQLSGYKNSYDEYLHIKEETRKIKKYTRTMTIVGSIIIAIEVIAFSVAVISLL